MENGLDWYLLSFLGISGCNLIIYWWWYEEGLFECGWCILIFFLYCIFFLLWSSNSLYLCSICSNKIPLLYLYISFKYHFSFLEFVTPLDSSCILSINHLKRKKEKEKRKKRQKEELLVDLENMVAVVVTRDSDELLLGRFQWKFVIMMMLKGMLWDICHNILGHWNLKRRGCFFRMNLDQKLCSWQVADIKYQILW